jgi:hypothetical protein
MEKAIVFRTVVRIRSDYIVDDVEYGFRFYVVDSSLVGQPEEMSSASHHKIKVTLTYELLINWRLDEVSEQDLVKVLFHFARRCVEEKVKNGTLRDYEELHLSMAEHPENRCPLDISRIPDPVGFVSRIDIDDQVELQKEMPVGHPNIIVLRERMDDALARDDYAGVLHASASIFETMAKDVVGIPTVQNQSLKSFFDRYRKDSALPNEILDYILATYERRSVTPLAGHGSTRTPDICKEEAIALAEMTKAFVKIEYNLRRRS